MVLFHLRCQWYFYDKFMMTMRRKITFTWKVYKQDCQVSMSKKGREATTERDLPKRTSSGHMWRNLSSVSMMWIDLSSHLTDSCEDLRRVGTWNKLPLKYLKSISSTRNKCCRGRWWAVKALLKHRTIWKWLQQLRAGISNISVWIGCVNLEWLQS